MSVEKTENKDSRAEKEGRGIEVGIASPSDLSGANLDALTESLVEGTHGKLGVRLEDSRMKIKDMMRSIRDGIEINDQGSIGKWSKKIEDSIYPQVTKKEYKEAYRRRLEQLLVDGQLVVGRLDGKVVGCIGFRRWHELEGKEVYETLKGTVLKQYRGKGYYSEIKNEAIELISSAHPDCPILTATKNPAVIGHMRKYFPSTQEIPLGAQNPVADALRRQIGEPEAEKMVGEGYVILWYEP